MNEASGAHWKSGQASSGLLSLRDSKYLPMALEASQMIQEEFDLWPPGIQQELVPMFLSAWDHNKRPTRIFGLLPNVVLDSGRTHQGPSPQGGRSAGNDGGSAQRDPADERDASWGSTVG